MLVLASSCKPALRQPTPFTQTKCLKIFRNFSRGRMARSNVAAFSTDGQHRRHNVAATMCPRFAGALAQYNSPPKRARAHDEDMRWLLRNGKVRSQGAQTDTTEDTLGSHPLHVFFQLVASVRSDTKSEDLSFWVDNGGQMRSHVPCRRVSKVSEQII